METKERAKGEQSQFEFVCVRCGVEVSAPLTELLDHALLDETDGADHVPAGFYWVSPSPDQDGGYLTDAAGQYLINLKDARNTKHHRDRRRLNGCCGLDGMDGRNTVCVNGHELGTERSDCWMAHSLALDPACVLVAPHIIR